MPIRTIMNVNVHKILPHSKSQLPNNLIKQIDVFEVITVHFKTFPVQEILAITSYVNNVILRVGMFLYLDFGKGILSVE